MRCCPRSRGPTGRAFPQPEPWVARDLRRPPGPTFAGRSAPQFGSVSSRSSLLGEAKTEVRALELEGHRSSRVSVVGWTRGICCARWMPRRRRRVSACPSTTWGKLRCRTVSLSRSKPRRRASLLDGSVEPRSVAGGITAIGQPRRRWTLSGIPSRRVRWARTHDRLRTGRLAGRRGGRCARPAGGRRSAARGSVGSRANSLLSRRSVPS